MEYELVGKAQITTTTAEAIAERLAARGTSVVEYEDGSRVETFPTAEAEVDPRDMSVEDLAVRLRARAIHASGYEYIEAEPPMELAKAVKAQLEAGELPETQASPDVIEALQQETEGGDGGRAGRYIIGSDTRVYVPSGNTWQVALLNGTNVQCSSTMISSKVAATAAHCVWDDSSGTWTLPGSWVPAANNTAPTQPEGTLTWTWVRVPNDLSTNSGWDYAYVEFSNSAAKDLSWLGTADTSSGTMHMVGFPGDKPMPQMWFKDGTVSQTTSHRRKHNLDIVPGDSGAAMYNLSSQLVGIQSTENWSQTCFAWICGSKSYWNEVERWRSTTYNFFAAGNWPD